MTGQTDRQRDVHYRAIIVEPGNMPSVAHADRLFGKRPIKMVRAGDGALCRLRVESTVKPPAYLARTLPQRVKGKNTYYTYEVCVSDVNAQGRRGMLVAGAVRRVLGDIQSRQASYLWLDLARICDDQFSSGSDPRVTVARLHLRLYGDLAGAVNSATLYGRDVLKAPTLRHLLAGRHVDVSSPPFVHLARMANTDRLLEVSSCRFNWDDGQCRFALNADQYGNFSFRFAGEQNIDAINAVLTYAVALGAVRYIQYDPTLKSDAALAAVQDGGTVG